MYIGGQPWIAPLIQAQAQYISIERRRIYRTIGHTITQAGSSEWNHHDKSRRETPQDKIWHPWSEYQSRVMLRFVTFFSSQTSSSSRLEKKEKKSRFTPDSINPPMYIRDVDKSRAGQDKNRISSATIQCYRSPPSTALEHSDAIYAENKTCISPNDIQWPFSTFAYTASLPL